MYLGHTFGSSPFPESHWGEVTQDVDHKARQSYFTVRIWRSSDLIDAALRNYEHLSEEIRNDLPLKRTWTLVLED